MIKRKLFSGIVIQSIVIVALFPVVIWGQQKETFENIRANNSEPSHAHFTLGKEKEILLHPVTDENGNNIHYDIPFRDNWERKQIFARFYGFGTPFQFLINGFRYGTGEGDLSAVEFNISPFLRPGDNRIDLLFEYDDRGFSDTSCRGARLITRDDLHVRDLRLTSYRQVGAPEAIVRVHLYMQSFITGPDKGLSLIHI